MTTITKPVWVLTDDMQIWDADDIRQIIRENYAAEDEPVDEAEIAEEVDRLPRVMKVGIINADGVFLTEADGVFLANADGDCRVADDYADISADYCHLWIEVPA